MGSIAGSQTFKSGIYVPTLTFFKDDEDQSVDVQRCVEHNIYLAKAGVAGLVLQGSTGEAVCLTREERRDIIAATSKALKEQNLGNVLIIAGIGGQCLQESLAYAKDAHGAGASFGIALAPSYFVGVTPDEAIRSYFTQLADRSPLPYLIYNFPAVTNGLNLSASFIASLSGHPNIVGTKLTCNTISKMQFLSPNSSNLKGDFSVFTGSSAYLPAGHAANIVGPITGVANLFPYTLVKLWNHVIEGKDQTEIYRLQNLVTNYEEIMTKDFIPGLRASLEILGQSAGHSRSPIPDSTEDAIKSYKSTIKDIAAEEKKLTPS